MYYYMRTQSEKAMLYRNFQKELIHTGDASYMENPKRKHNYSMSNVISKKAPSPQNRKSNRVFLRCRIA
jgi:hypothetical protein